MVGPGMEEATTAKEKISVDLKNSRHLDGLSSSELSMILRLAGNDTEVRKKTIRKLKKWLGALAMKVPNTSEARELIEPNFIRVWKALFYCMWMADKPLPQELLADQISSLVTLFASKPNVLIIFVEWFFITFAREWEWIDRLRLDKFMMLIRRFLRKTLEAFVQNNWRDEIVDPFLKILTVHLFNRHPPAPKTRAKARTPDPVKSPLGLQIHITDILLEELAKVGAGSLETRHILKMISPFINELRDNDDERLLNQINQRIFHHLMKQSDVGIEYVESRGGRLVRVEADEDEEDADEEEDDSEDEQIPTNGGPLDPRAGAVDVVLPQLELDYEELIQKLIEAGGQKGTRAKNRKLLYGLARQFHTLVKGEFPLAFPREDTRTPAIPRKEIQNAAKRLIEMEEGLVEPRSKKRKSKKREEPVLSLSEASNDSIGSEDNSMYLNDDELLDHVGDNYMSYLVEMDKDEEEEVADKPKKKVKPTKKTALKLSKKAKASEADLVDLEDDDNTENCVEEENSPAEESQDTYVVIKRKRKSSEGANSKQKNGEAKKRKTLTLSPKEPVNEVSIKTPSSSPAKGTTSNVVSPSLKKNSPNHAAANGSGKKASPKNKNKLVQSSPTKGTPSPKTGKRNGINSTPANTLPATPSSASGLKKRVNFVLAKNLEHPHSDYQDSIQRSPAIPFDSNRRPSIGLLKSPASKNINGTPAGRLSTTPRRLKAADFFQ